MARRTRPPCSRGSRSPPADSRTPWVPALGASVLGDAWRYGGPPVQVGYLRLVTGERPDASADAELAVRWRWPGLVRPPAPADPARWADAGQAAALLPVEVAPARAPPPGVISPGLRADPSRPPGYRERMVTAC